MRLSKQYVTIIRETVIQRFGPAAKVSLFGSRVNEGARGGDIDLLVELVNVPTHPFRETIGLETDLQLALGDQKIDILLRYPGSEETPIYRIAKQTAVKL